MDPYSVLGVDRKADTNTIRKAYRKLAKKYHPDMNKDPSAEGRFKEVNAAYEAIEDPERRKLYDEFGEAALHPNFDAQQARRFSAGGGNPFGGGGPDMGNVDMEDLLGSLFGNGFGSFDRGKTQRKGADQQAEITIDFLSTVIGADHELRLRRADGGIETLKVHIPAGAKDGGRLRLRGHGLPPRGGGQAGDLHVTLRVSAHALLKRIDDDLEMEVPITVEEAMVGGSITVPTPTGDVKVTVPPGIGNGMRLRLKGRGIQKSNPTDLFLVLRPTVPRSDDPAVQEAARRISSAYPGDVRAGLRL
ncbi:MAG: DnaJ domain-containing protein [Deltaproteobacteria bacterium]|nr:DnaJ domain-containing protein [Deltaproteobacteria bacterium]